MKEGCNENMSDMEKMDQTQAAEQKAQAPSAEAKSKKDKAPAKKDKKPGVFARFGRWLREMRSELKKVSWPSGKTTMKNVGTVIVCVIVVGVFIWVFDWLIHAVIQALLGLFA